MEVLSVDRDLCELANVTRVHVELGKEGQKLDLAKIGGGKRALESGFRRSHQNRSSKLEGMERDNQASSVQQ